MRKRSPFAQDSQKEMLGSVLEFMAGSGLSDSVIRDAFERGLSRLHDRSRERVASRVSGLCTGNENLSAELLRVWHRDNRYIDGDARPKPLPLQQGRSNLRSILQRVDPSADAIAILREMIAVKLIRKSSSGKYLPTSDVAIVRKLHPLATDHIAKLVIRLVSTVSRNVDPDGATLPLIERHAYAPDLGWAERKAFAEFTRAQGMAYLESVDNWLEQRRVRRRVPSLRSNAKGVSASVHLFAYLGDNEAPSSLSDQGEARRQRVVKSKRNSKAISRSRRSPPPREARA